MTAAGEKSTKGLHIGQFIDSMDPGGAEEVVTNLSSALVDSGVNVTVFHFGNEWLRAATEEAGLNTIELDRENYKSISRILLFVWYFRRILKEHKIDVLHSHLLGAVFSGALSARAAGIGAVGTVHDTYSLEESRKAPWLLRLAAYAGSKIVVVADAMQQRVTELTHISRDRLIRIYNGITTDVPQRQLTQAKAAEVKLICVARLVSLKRHDLLIDALYSLNTSVAPRLLLVGDGPERDSLEAQATRLGLRERISFLGHRSDVKSLLADSDIYVLVSDTEGLSVSVLESMAAGLPAVVTDVGGNCELVQNGKSGYVVAPGAVSDIAAALNDLCGSANKRESYGLSARKKIEADFSLSAMLKSYLNVFSGVI